VKRENARVPTADAEQAPLLPSGPGGVHKSTFHGPWHEQIRVRHPCRTRGIPWIFGYGPSRERL